MFERKDVIQSQKHQYELRALNEETPSYGYSCILELELMNQWGDTIEWIMSPPELAKFYKHIFANLAFSNPFLLHAMFALAAAHLNRLTPCSRYQDAARQYFTKALNGQRAELARGLDHRNAIILAAAGMIIAVYTFTIDIDPEFGGLQQGWLPMFQGLREFFFASSLGSIFLKMKALI